jgi:hypothetical protein
MKMPKAVTMLLKALTPTTPDLPTHSPGVRKGNSPGHYEKMPGHLPNGHSTALRSTGLNPKKHDPILPQMPNISPP